MKDTAGRRYSSSVFQRPSFKSKLLHPNPLISKGIVLFQPSRILLPLHTRSRMTEICRTLGTKYVVPHAPLPPLHELARIWDRPTSKSLRQRWTALCQVHEYTLQRLRRIRIQRLPRGTYTDFSFRRKSCVLLFPSGILAFCCTKARCRFLNLYRDQDSIIVFLSDFGIGKAVIDGCI